MKLSANLFRPDLRIKNIIFDWGGVITDTYPQETIKRLSALSEASPDFHSERAAGYVFTPFETGAISADEFRNRIRILLDAEASDASIDDAWNAMLGLLPMERYTLLGKLKSHFRTFLLSNTNVIHRNHYYNYLMQQYGTNGFTRLFEKTYYSFELGMRKPDSSIYEFVLKDSGLNAEETLFIDDADINVQAARKVGIHAYQLEQPLTLIDLFGK